MNPLNELLNLAQQREDLERQIIATVAAARADGASWQAIANMIGGTKQAAQQRYGKQIAAQPTPATEESVWTSTPQLATAEVHHTSKKVDEPAPATHQLVHLGGSLPTDLEKRTGKGPASCPACGRQNHKAAGYFHCAEVTPECSPTKYDTQSITDYLTGNTPAYTPSY